MAAVVSVTVPDGVPESVVTLRVLVVELPLDGGGDGRSVSPQAGEPMAGRRRRGVRGWMRGRHGLLLVWRRRRVG